MSNESSPRIRVAYLHGRGSTANTQKATFLANYKDASGEPLLEIVAETYDTSDLKAAIKWAEGFIARNKVDVLAGSSFGGAVAVNLLRSGAWKGPTLLLAQAYSLYVGEHRVPEIGLPDGIPVTLIHGTIDSIVPFSGSQVLAQTGTKDLVKLVEFEDEHRLERLTTDLAGVYVEEIQELFAKGASLG